MQVMAAPYLRPFQALQGPAGRIPSTRTNFGSRPTKTTSRPPLHQRHVAHFLCVIGMSLAMFPRTFVVCYRRGLAPRKNQAASPAAVLWRRLVCLDGKRAQRTPHITIGTAFPRFRYPVRMITSLSEGQRRNQHSKSRSGTQADCSVLRSCATPPVQASSHILPYEIPLEKLWGRFASAEKRGG